MAAPLNKKNSSKGHLNDPKTPKTAVVKTPITPQSGNQEVMSYLQDIGARLTTVTNHIEKVEKGAQ